MNKFRIIFYSLLAMLLIGALYFHVNIANIYAQIGNYYYSHNDVHKAQKYCE